MYHTKYKMRICPKCNIKKIKNGYQQCFDCNNAKEDTTSEPDNEATKRESIPKCVRNAVWRHLNGNQIEAKCVCCLVETVSIGNFHVGHIKSVFNGGSTKLNNLTVLCMLCNTSSGKCDLFEFIEKYDLHYYNRIALSQK